jgi:flagellin
MERLSSGKRINQAGDDAAGLTIAHQMDNQIASLNQATRNANDGIAMINMAEGAMDQFSAMLTRMKELATQSSNGIYSNEDRANLNKEFTALKQEISRIADVTIYNGISVLNNEAGDVKYQVGDKSSDTIDVTYKDMQSTAIGSADALATADREYVPDSTTYATTTSTAWASGTAQVDKVTVSTAAQTGFEQFGISVTIGSTTTEYKADTLDNLATAIAANSDIASASVATGGVLSITGNATGGVAFTTGSLVKYDLKGDSVSNLNAANILNTSDAQVAMASVDKAMKEVDSYRSDLGAKANQLEHTASNLMTRVQYTSAARSRIMDADYATESANLAKAQVLQQAGTAMLAQANASTQNVLSLLK